MAEVSAMDDRVKQAIDFSKYRMSLFNLKENIKTKFDSMLMHAINGGVFRSTPELLTFVKMIIDAGKSSVVLIDINGNPIEITDIPTFHDELFDRYFRATNYYHAEYSKLRKARSVQELFPEIK